MKNKQKNGKKSYLYIIFLALAFIILLGTGAYAYYQTTITGTITGNVAKWSFKANNQTSTFNLDFGSLYPGKEATYYLELSAEDSDLPVVFEIILNLSDASSTGFYDLNHVLYSRIFFDIENSKNNGMLGIKGVKGYILPGATATIPIYYNWSYQHSEETAEWSVQHNLTGQNVTAQLTIIGRQADVSDMETVEASMGTDLLGLTDSNNCSNGIYSYSNIYGWPCELFNFTHGEFLYASEVSGSFILADGTQIEIPLYCVKGIVVEFNS